MRKFLAYFIPVLLCFAVGLLSSYVQSSAIEEWYPTLVKSPITPPNMAFPIAWSIIYLFVGLSIGCLLVRGDMSVVRLWILQLVVNFLWSVLFFAMRSPLLGLIDILILDVLVFTYIVYAAGRRKLAAWLFAPYFVWILFATYLNGYVYLHNHHAGNEVARTEQPVVVVDEEVVFAMPPLPYALEAFGEKMSRETLEYHYGKHLQTYVDNLNRLVKDTRYETMPLEEIIVESDGALLNNAAQTWNHRFFFEGLTPNPTPMPKKLAERLVRDFGSVTSFKEQFAKAANGLFGSGWVWLAEDKDGRLAILSESNAGNPLRRGFKPILALDVWEHAYYIDYRNRRSDFVEAYWDMVDWNKVAERLGMDGD